MGKLHGEENVVPTRHTCQCYAVSRLRQAVEVFKQLKGTVEATRLVRDAEIGMTHNVGGSGATCAVHIFGRERNA